jgi:hypothetical protein
MSPAANCDRLQACVRRSICGFHPRLAYKRPLRVRRDISLLYPSLAVAAAARLRSASEQNTANCSQGQVTWSGRGRGVGGGLILGWVGIAGEDFGVAPDERTMDPWEDARVGLRAHDDEAPHTETRQRSLECGGLEGFARSLLDYRLGVARRNLGHDPPDLGSRWQPFVAVPDPEDRDSAPLAFPARLRIFAKTTSRW